MIRSVILSAAFATFCACTTAPAPPPADTTYRPALVPGDWRSDMAGPTTRVMVLGSPHISAYGPEFERARLEPLLDRLEAFSPEIITYEGLSGEACDVLQRNPDIYPGTFDQYCWPLDEATQATGLDFAHARAEAERLLADWPALPTPDQRRHLAALFVASGDRPSAMVQWLQLPADERREGDGVDAWMTGVLNRVGARPNENVDVAAVLAARLGLQRIYPVDDHSADSIQAAAGAGFEPAIMDIWTESGADTDPVLADLAQRQKAAASGGDLLDLYRALNTPAAQLAAIDTDFHRALRTPSDALYGRQYVGWYETRNLRMVANIRAAFANHPGARVLNIVGASHKAHYEAYLSQMHEVELVDVASVLGD